MRYSRTIQRTIFSCVSSIFFCISPIFSFPYYVSTSGNDLNSGSINAPFCTIQKAASLMVSGDTCFIRQGTYRETIIPVNSGTEATPITYINYPGEIATISGADSITGWSLYKGKIYKAKMAWDLGVGQNQIFVNGVMMVQARFPNTGNRDLLSPTLASNFFIHSKSKDTINAPALKQPDNFWVGGYFWGLMEPQWTSQSARIIASKPGQFVVDKMSNPWYPQNSPPWSVQEKSNGEGFVWGVLSALDTVTEWHLQDSTLYLWPPENKNPSSLKVEAKRRELLFDLNNRSFITIKGLHFFAGTGKMTGNNCTVDSCTMMYLSHYLISNGYGARGGLEISSSKNMLINCDLSYSSGHLVRLGGSDNTIRNCIIHEAGMVGEYGSLIQCSGTRNIVEYNSLFNSKIAMLLHGKADTIRYNDIYRWGHLTSDLGGIYSCCNVDGFGTTIANNWMHDEVYNYNHYGGAIYLDRCCHNFNVFSNVFFNTKAGMSGWGPGFKVYNNTGFDLYYYGFNPRGKVAVPVSIECKAEIDEKNTLNCKQNPFDFLVDPDRYNFQLKPGSLAIDKGVTIPDFTRNSLGSAPDLGAYESGDSAWTAGCSRVVPVRTSIKIVQSFAFTSGEKSKGTVELEVEDLSTQCIAKGNSWLVLSCNPGVFSLPPIANCEIDFSLQPLQKSTKQFVLDLLPGVHTIETMSSTPGVRPYHITIDVGLMLPRIKCADSLKDVGLSLLKIKPLKIVTSGFQIATIHCAVLNNNLALYADVIEPKVTRGTPALLGSGIEVYGAMKRDNNIGQVLLFPATDTCGVLASHLSKDSVVSAPGIKLKSTPTKNGYALTALIPFSYLKIDDNADRFLFELMVNSARFTKDNFTHYNLFGSVSAFQNTAKYASVQVKK